MILVQKLFHTQYKFYFYMSTKSSPSFNLLNVFQPFLVKNLCSFVAFIFLPSSIVISYMMSLFVLIHRVAFFGSILFVVSLKLKTSKFFLSSNSDIFILPAGVLINVSP